VVAARDVKAVDGVGLVPTEILAPCPPAPNGPAISSATSRCFCSVRRVSRAGFNRVRISLSGNVTVLWSCSPPELTNRLGMASRNSPKLIFTEPNASWVRILFKGMEMTAPGCGVCMTLARKSIGIAARMDCSGNCNSSGFSADPAGMLAAGAAGVIGAEETEAADGAVRGNAPAAGATVDGGTVMMCERGA